jgi:hypothetical protein
MVSRRRDDAAACAVVVRFMTFTSSRGCVVGPSWSSGCGCFCASVRLGMVALGNIGEVVGGGRRRITDSVFGEGHGIGGEMAPSFARLASLGVRGGG